MWRAILSQRLSKNILITNGFSPQVAFEILSPSNKDRQGLDYLEEKFDFYPEYGIQKYYIYDPDDLMLAGWQRQSDRLMIKISSMMDELGKSTFKDKNVKL
ncbi:MAG: hypothetical protein DCF19_07405 [Pseudanabaena frigida]|uniref:Uncharacterized protein n=1 Tax=Pseudanabaena frigida TaxID=945775 RepID=A0A2W4WGU3_9CYAN|nr:MAG: hypothetical protein DCF19_07405 [Pseudanabaena frigida]